MKKPLALIIDDEPDIRKLLEITLTRMDISCLMAENLKTAYALLQAHRFDICLVDMHLPDGNGLDIITYIQEEHLQLPVAVITAHGNMGSAIQALKSGAFDFLSKPVDLEILRKLIKNALRPTAPETGTENDALLNRFIGKTKVIEATRQTIAKLQRSQAPVYISGETGTGKELVAQIIHQQSSRSAGEFVPVNCSAIPTELMESEMFGHVKGSFSGAITDNEGLFRTSDGGTLFLDEIAELPIHMQVKLLRAIQEKSIRPVGGTKELPVDVRILSATHQDLHALIQQGKFRQDLFYRINVIEINVPPLRERVADIPLLVAHILQHLNSTMFTSEHSEKINKPFCLSKEALAALSTYHFPGNIRELENILQRAITFCDSDTIHVDDLQLPTDENHTINKQTEPHSLDSYLHEIEKQTILEVLGKTRWNRTQAAKLLGISFRALRYKLSKLNLQNNPEAKE